MEVYPHGHGVLATLGFAALTGSSVVAVYRSMDDPRSVAFVAGAYASIALLFHFLRRFERGEGDGRCGKKKGAVWLLTTLPGIGVYLMAAGTSGAGFWALFHNS